MQRPKLSAVLPVHNEDEILEELSQRLTAVLQGLAMPYEIIFVNDGSTDRSALVLERIRTRDEHFVIVELTRNYGQTAALAAGIDYARGEIIVTLDADLQHAPEDIPRFLETLDQGYDLVSGWRMTRSEAFFSRRLPSMVANAVVRVLSGIPIRDFGSTYKMYRAELVKRIELFGELHRFIPVLAHRIGARMIEIPIEAKPRPKGSSKYGLGRVFGVFQDLIFLEFYSNYLTKPIRAFGKLAFFFFGCGFMISATLMLLWCFGRIKAVLEHEALLLFSVMLMIMGLQFFVAGIFAELLTRVYLHTSNSKIYSVRRVLGSESDSESKQQQSTGSL